MEGHNSLRAILYAFLANLGIGITKLAAAIYTGSGSMLAEAIHSFADTSNQILLFIGLKRSQRPPDEKHPLGYGKTIYFWSFLVAILLFSMGGLFSIYEGIHKLESKESIQSPWIALVVLGISIILEFLSLLGALKEIYIIKKETPLFQWLKESTKAELVVVFGEDVAALLGLIIAFLFVFLAYYLKNPVFDAIGSICIGILLIIISLMICIRIKSMIIGESANQTIKEEINQIISQIQEIEKVFRVITVQLGPDVMLSAKIKLKSHLNIEQAVKIINQLEKKIKQKIPDIKWSFIEPDIKD
ncbi:MAG: cation diffusion facilitator transporter [Leptospiraceae bacterium]|nr:MAG: cation diffusion facilitator transporter [Leptospiraceae bacterium]